MALFVNVGRTGRMQHALTIQMAPSWVEVQSTSLVARPVRVELIQVCMQNRLLQEVNSPFVAHSAMGWLSALTWLLSLTQRLAWLLVLAPKSAVSCYNHAPSVVLSPIVCSLHRLLHIGFVGPAADWRAVDPTTANWCNRPTSTHD